MESVTSVENLKAAAKQALLDSNYEEAYGLYAAALSQTPHDPFILCNKAFAGLKLGFYDRVVSDVDAALQMLSAPHFADSALQILPKLYHQKAQAHLLADHLVPALRTYKEGLAACPETPSFFAAARLALDEAPLNWLAAYWSRIVHEAQQPHPLSSRDGKLLKLVPRQHRMTQSKIQSHLCRFFQEPFWLEESKELICTVWSEKRPPWRAEAAFFRAAVYLQADNAEQAQRDAAVATSYGPKDSEETSVWPAALMLQSAAFEASGDNVPALIHAAMAFELDAECTLAEDAIERLSRRVPEHYAEAVHSGGASRLKSVIAAEKERNLPPFLRPKPKYYYYYEWMRKRIEARHPNLPDPITDKLLALDANELDLLLQYPAAIDGTVAALEGVLAEKGEEALATSAVPLLSWEQKKAFEEEAQQLLEAPKTQQSNLLEATVADGGSFEKEDSDSESVKEVEEPESVDDKEGHGGPLFSLD